MSLLVVDYLVALYNVAMVLVWAPLVTTSGAARWMITVHLAALSVPWLLSCVPRLKSRGARWLREIYPLLWVLAFWKELDVHCQLVGSAPNDLMLAALDRTLFGVNLNVTWAPAVGLTWVGELMQLLYFSYYALLVGIVLRLLFGRDRNAVRDLALRLSAVYLAAYVVYAVAPTAGPMTMFPRFEGPGTHGVFRWLNDWLQASGDAAGTAFPSTHVAGAVTLAWLAWRYCSRGVAWLAVLLAIGVGPATVYTQNHFVLDAVAGGLLGLALQGLVLPALVRARASLAGVRPLRALLPRTEAEAA